MCASGLPSESRGHAIQICLAALEMQHYLGRTNAQREKMRMPRWDMRIGIHTGPVIAGVVGKRKFTYDIWGDAVNIASLIEQAGEPSEVTISETTLQNVNEVFDNHEPRAELLQVHTLPNVDMNSIGITIVFSIINSTVPTQLDLMIERVR